MTGAHDRAHDRAAMTGHRAPPGAPAPGLPVTAGRAGSAGLIAVAVSVACTFAVAVAGPSVMEPALPGRPGQPPWSWDLHPSPYLVIGLTAAGLAAGALGLVLTLRAVRRGWAIPARAVLAAGLLAAAALTLVPPFGSSDHLSYAAYGRMLVTGHNPYTTTPAQLAALGDPVARAVQDWRGTPSVYGPLATAIQALASLAGGTSVRLTVFVLGLANLAAFAATALLLHRMTRHDPARQRRAALLWAANPVLLQVLVAGAHVDGQAVAFGVAAVAVMSPVMSRARRRHQIGPRRHQRRQRAARCRARRSPGSWSGWGSRSRSRSPSPAWGSPSRSGTGAGAARQQRAGLWPALAALGAGFAVTAGAALAIGGSAMLRQTSQASDMVSIGSPWRVIRSVIHLAVTGTAATDIVKAGAVALAVLLAVLLIRGLAGGRAGRARSWRARSWPGVRSWPRARIRAGTRPSRSRSRWPGCSPGRTCCRGTTRSAGPCCRWSRWPPAGRRAGRPAGWPRVSAGCCWPGPRRSASATCRPGRPTRRCRPGSAGCSPWSGTG